MKKPEGMLDMMRMKGKDLSNLNEETGYMLGCGKCVDPCALKFRMEKDEDDDMEGMDINTIMGMMGGEKEGKEK